MENGHREQMHVVGVQALGTRLFHAHEGRCYYWNGPMWLRSPDESGLRPRLASPFQCTAEHLLARQDGGKDVVGNVLTACHLCNRRRHRRPTPAPSPETYRVRAQRRMVKGTWHPALAKGGTHKGIHALS